MVTRSATTASRPGGSPSSHTAVGLAPALRSCLASAQAHTASSDRTAGLGSGTLAPRRGILLTSSRLTGYENRQPIDSRPPVRRPPPSVPALPNRLAAAYLGGEVVGDCRLRCRVLALGGG